MDPLLGPKPFRDMTAAERQALLRRRVADTPDEQSGLAIDSGSAGRRIAAVAMRAIAGLGVATLFVLMFVHFTASWRVAMAVVAFMLAWMIVIGKMTEGKADQPD